MKKPYQQSSQQILSYKQPNNEHANLIIMSSSIDSVQKLGRELTILIRVILNVLLVMSVDHNFKSVNKKFVG